MDSVSEETLADFKTMIQIHHSNYGLGEIYVVITSAVSVRQTQGNKNSPHLQKIDHCFMVFLLAYPA